MNLIKKPERRGKMRRAEKTAANRRALIHAAADVIGDYGYDGASISRITSRAGLAQGTFYLYFESRTSLFDILLPEITVEMLDAISEKTRGSANYLEVEERGFRTFLELSSKSKSLFRIINEAPVAAPKAFKKHLNELIRRYVSSLKRGAAAGDITGIKPSEFHALAYLLIGARNYLFLHYSSSKKTGNKSLNQTVSTYMHVVRNALSKGS